MISDQTMIGLTAYHRFKEGILPFVKDPVGWCASAKLAGKGAQDIIHCGHYLRYRISCQREAAVMFLDKGMIDAIYQLEQYFGSPAVRQAIASNMGGEALQIWAEARLLLNPA